jgi:hypothetical protein
MTAMAELAATYVDRAELLRCIEAQHCPWCGRSGLRSLSSHTVRAHAIYAADIRELAGLAPNAPLCSEGLSERHRELARSQETGRWLQRPEVLAAAAATREGNYDAEQRSRRVAQLRAVRPDAVEAFRRSIEDEKSDPGLAAARRLARSEARRKLRPGAECPICGVWFCTVVPVGSDYRQRKISSDRCRSEALRRLRTRTWVRHGLAGMGVALPDHAD